MNDHERAVVALLPFVRAWNLPLNPENLDTMVEAVLSSQEYDEDDESRDDILALSESLIEADAAAHRRMLEAMNQENHDNA